MMPVGYNLIFHFKEKKTISRPKKAATTSKKI